MRLVDVEKLYEKTAEWESQALEHVNRLNEQEGDETPSLEWCRWNAILGERSAFKYDIMDAPIIDAVPVVRCKDCKQFYREVGCWCSFFETDVSDTDYCSRGERKDEKT